VALNVAADALTLDDMTYTTTLVFTDADMIFPASWFSTVEAILSAPGASDPDRATLYLTRSRDLSPEATADLPVHWMPQPTDADLYRASTIHPTVGQGAAMVIPRQWFEKVGGFDETYQTWGCDDSDAVLRAQWDGVPVEWLPEDTAWVAHQYHTRTWPTPEQVEHVRANRAYLAERMAERGPIIRNQREGT
jgi:GT2 family glycosyltransferase